MDTNTLRQKLNQLEIFKDRLEQTIQYTNEQIKEIKKELIITCQHKNLTEIQYRGEKIEVVYECQDCGLDLLLNDINYSNVNKKEYI